VESCLLAGDLPPEPAYSCLERRLRLVGIPG
jgi:hypothetical protein